MLFPLARHFILCLIPVQPRKRLDMTENVDLEWDVKQQIKQTKHYMNQLIPNDNHYGLISL